MHAFIFCRLSRKSWKESEWWSYLKDFEASQAIDIIHFIGNKKSKENFEKFCYKLWAVWKDRCEIIHNKNSGHIILGCWADQALSNYQKAQQYTIPKGQTLVDKFHNLFGSNTDRLTTIFVDAAFDD